MYLSCQDSAAEKSSCQEHNQYKSVPREEEKVLYRRF